MTLPVVRVFVGTPAYRGIEVATARSLLELAWAVDAERGIDVEPKFRLELVGFGLQEGYGWARNAEAEAEIAVRLGADVFLHVEADVSFAPADVVRLVETWALNFRLGVVGAMYRSSRGGPMVGRLVGMRHVNAAGEPDPDGAFTAAQDVDDIGPHAVQADRLGFGFIAIPVSLLKQLQGERGYAFEETTRGAAAGFGDASFCREALARGWHLVAELRARPQHMQRVWT